VSGWVPMTLAMRDAYHLEQQRRIEVERDEAKQLSEKLAGQLIDSIGQISAAGAELFATRDERDLARAELASARIEMELLRERVAELEGRMS
jgi:hypothetical protein